jgi:hypothetical protein
LETGLAALFGPSSSITSSHVQSICDTLEIPHVESRWDYRLVREDHSINLYPHPQALGQVRQVANPEGTISCIGPKIWIWRAEKRF